MDNNNPSAGSGQSNNFFSGFLLGALVGAFVVFLLGTKKGKRLLKAISEEGAGNISNLLEEADRFADLDGIEDEKKEASADEMPKRREINIEKTVVQKPVVRRFFRGISRRVN